MPIRKVVFASNADLSKAFNVDYIYKLNGKKPFCEEEKQKKVIHCFTCHCFNRAVAAYLKVDWRRKPSSFPPFDVATSNFVAE